MRPLSLLLLGLVAACQPETKPGDDSAADVVDADGDGHAAAVDCDDEDAAVRPDAAEACNGVDDDCDGDVDEDDAIDAGSWYADDDGDGYGDATTLVTACSAPTGHVADDGDCDDADPAYHPGADEADCTDPADYNCDGSIGYADLDGDGWAACAECDDGAIGTNPDAVEACNAVDDDCDGVVDEPDAMDAATWYLDGDGDGHGDPGASTVACAPPEGYVAAADDCDDTRADVSPGADERCDGATDENCDGVIDEDAAADATTWYADADGDGFGDAGATWAACVVPAAHVGDATDCDDARATVNPAAAESCGTSFDDDCDGATNEQDAALCVTWYEDGDADGYGSTTSQCWCDAVGAYTAATDTDCDDARSAVSPSGTESCATPYDDDCDGDTNDLAATGCTTFYEDLDTDGFGSTTSACLCDAEGAYTATDGRDCDDGAAAVSPAGTETCATPDDDDCDGSTNDPGAVECTPWFYDGDGDGYGEASLSVCQCTGSGAYTAFGSTDCDDAVATTNPGAAETCATPDDDDCDGVSNELGADACIAWYTDGDGDGYGTGEGACYCSATGGYTTDDGDDCDDADTAVSPAATETWYDGADQDCDGADDYDQDGDGYASDTSAGTDCDDTDATVNPGRSETSNGVDDDCDDMVDNLGTWHTETVDSTGSAGDYIAIAVDADGDPHFSYEDDDDYLQYSVEARVGYGHTNVMTYTDIDVNSNALVVDSDGYARFLMYDDDDEYVRYAYYTSAGLSATTLDSTTSSGWISHHQLVGLDIDASDRSHAAWHDRDSDVIRYYRGTTSLSSVGSATVDGVAWLDAAYDAANDGFGVAYVDSDANSAVLLYFDGSTATSSTIDTSVNVADPIAVDFDSDGTPHVVYWDDDNDRVRYAYLDGSTWRISTLRDFATANLHGIELEIDADDVLHVAFSDTYGDDLYYSYGTSGSWTTTTVTSGSQDPWWIDLALDPWGNPHIAWRDTDNYDAMYTYFW